MAEQEIEILAETEDFSVWRTRDPDGEMLYHVELGSVTFHFFHEDWDQFLELIGQLPVS
jgi:hypothetical protein